MGMETVEYSATAFALSSLLQKLDAEKNIPEYLREREFKDLQPLAKIQEDGKRLLDQAERDSTLTAAQVLIGRIMLILDHDSAENLKLQSALLAQLLATQPVSYIHMLGQDRFFESKRYRPAAECFKRYLEAYPDDLAIRLNSGVAYNQIGMFAEAEAAVDYVLEHNMELGPHGVHVASEVKAVALLGRGDFKTAISFAEKAEAAEHGYFHLCLIMLAAAELGDVEKVREAAATFRESQPQEFAPREIQVVAVEAFALVKSNQRARAQELISQWKNTDRIEGRLKSFWRVYPSGADVVNNWNSLTRN